MSSTFFERLRDRTGLRLLTKFGDTFRVTSSSGSTFDPTTGSVTTTSVTQDLKGKQFAIASRFDGAELVEMDMSEIYLTASGAAFDPKEGMTVATPADFTAPYRIAKVERIPDSGTVVMYKLTVAR